jgi:hypothetical protein
MDKKSKGKLWDRFEDLSLNTSDKDATAAAEFLAELGINPTEESQFGAQEIRRLHFLARARSNESRDKTLLEKLKSKILEAVERNKEMTTEILKQAMTEKKASFQFRNIEKWSDEEMREVLNDLEITKLLDDLDNVK